MNENIHKLLQNYLEIIFEIRDCLQKNIIFFYDLRILLCNLKFSENKEICKKN